MPLLIYTQIVSARVNYIFTTLLSACGLTNCYFTTDKVAFLSTQQPKLNYSHQSIAAEEFWLYPAALLSENDIKEQAITCFQFHETKAFFKTEKGDFPFDIFAASFYLISRYEEYLPHKKDMYGRYAHENSLAFKEGFLPVPLVNVWLKHLTEDLLKKFPSLHLTPPAFRHLPTYDIDMAWSYLHKGWLRNLGGFINDIAESEWTKVSERINVLFGSQQDPFDSYDWLNKLHSTSELKPIYFFLLAEKNKGYDKNILPSRAAMRKLVQQLAARYAAAIHPSWQSGDDPKLMANEKKTLEALTRMPVCKSRQHYIRMTLPATYRTLIDAGITEDYSMGYGSINGFRSSYCLPHFWYDLPKEETTSLTVYPFCYMDANSYYEQHYNCEEALNEMQYYRRAAEEVNGLFITIWHNHFVGTNNKFAGWREVYKRFISSDAIKP